MYLQIYKIFTDISGAYNLRCPKWCARSSSVKQSATCKFDLQGPSTFVHWQTRALCSFVGCATQTRDEVKAWVRSNAGVLLSSGRGFESSFQQGSIPGDAGGPLAHDAPHPHNTVQIMPDGDEIMRGMFGRLRNGQGGMHPKSQCTLPGVFHGVSVLVQDATSNK